MKTVKMFALAAVAMTLGFTSCTKNNENENPIDTQDKTVSLSLGSEGVDPGSRANSTTAENLKTTVSSGQVIFTESTGTITNSYTIVTGVTATSGTNINIADLTKAGGYAFTKVSGTKVYVLINKTVATAIKGANISTVTGATLGLADLRSGGFTDAVLYGTTDLVLVSAGKYTATVNVKPTFARIEISKMTDISLSADYWFDPTGIYINNYYTGMTIAGTTSGLTNHGQPEANYSTAYHGTGALHNVFSAPTGVKTFAPASGVWAYNVFPSSGVANLPHIILRMANLKKGATHATATHVFTPATTNYYVTISTYGANTTFVAGKVYKIGDIRFDASQHGGTLPEDPKHEAKVTVVVESWGGITLTPDVN